MHVAETAMTRIFFGPCCGCILLRGKFHSARGLYPIPSGSHPEALYTELYGDAEMPMVVWQVSQPTWVMTPSKPKREGKARPRTLGAFKRPAASRRTQLRS